MKSQSLQNAAGWLKHARGIVVSRKTTIESRHLKLFEGADGACKDLLSACRNAISRAEARLEQAQAQSKEKLATATDNGRLIELAVNLVRAVNNPAQYEDTRNLCSLKEVATGVLETLATVKASEPGNDPSTFVNYALTDSLQTIGVELEELRLFAVKTPAKAAGRAAVNLQGPSEHQSFSGSETASCVKLSERIRGTNEMQPLLLEHEIRPAKTKASSSSKSIRQLKKMEKKVLSVNLPRDPSTSKHRGCGYIEIRPSVSRGRILEIGHVLYGVRIHVRQFHSNQVNPNENTDVQNIAVQNSQFPQQQPSTSKRKAPSPPKPLEQQGLSQ
ncbi:hypothetical protein SprV_0200961000 [Sparganum proliferum]